jgi:hypothetical protein
MDRFEHAVEILDDIVVPEAQDAESRLLQQARATPIFLGSRRVLATVQLDDELLLMANEIGCEAEDRFLSTELRVVELAIAQAAPQQFLNVGGIGS